MAELAGTTSPGFTATQASRAPDSIENRASWVAATAALVWVSFAYGSPLLVVVGLKPITEDLGTVRQVVALAAAVTWIGTGLGGILMGWIADRLGMRATVLFGSVMIATGLAVSTVGGIWGLLIGHAVFLGLLGNGAFFPPLIVYVSRWFDRRRGTALALISSGQYIAGMIWPSAFEYGIANFGWRSTMLAFAGVVLVAVPPIAFLFLAPPPAITEAPHPSESGAVRHEVLGLPANLVLAVLSIAGFCCCVPMALPQSHLVAFCSDVGIAAATGAIMLSVLQACAFVSRQFWGWMADRVGGLITLLAGSACQALAVGGFMLTQDEAGLFAVSAAYGLGFSGIVPAYVLVVRDLYPSS